MLGLDTRTIRGQARLVGVLLVTIGVVLLVVTAAQGLSSLSSVKDLSAVIARTNDQILPLRKVVHDMRLDAVQVQQFFTDAGATRRRVGADGDDSFREAADWAKHFNDDADAAAALSRALGLDGLNRVVSAAKTDFPAYFALGQTMAEAYIAGGTEAGNKMMTDFDATAHRLIVDLDAAFQQIDVLTAADRAAAERREGEAWRMVMVSLVAVAVALLAAAVVVIIIVRRLLAASDILRRGAEAMAGAARGDLNARTIRIGRTDEIGDLLRNANRVLDLAEAFAKEAGAAMSYASKKQYFRKIVEDGMRGEFVIYSRRINDVISSMEARDTETIRFSEQNVVPVIDTATRKTAELRASASTLNGIAQTTIEQSMVVAAAAEQATVNVQSVASAAVELSASIGEINRQMVESSRLADEAVSEARQTNHTVDGLNAAAQKIGDVVSLIRDIAGQTNLLALNATIEAARAGEAGKGFAVVAGEVKNLANQTARATEDITAQVAEMQRIATETVVAIQGVGRIITNINDNIVSVADAVDAQGDATAEISRNVQEAATGTNEVARNIVAVTQGARETEAMAGVVLRASDDLAGQADTLQRDMALFIDRVRSA